MKQSERPELKYHDSSDERPVEISWELMNLLYQHIRESRNLYNACKKYKMHRELPSGCDRIPRPSDAGNSIEAKKLAEQARRKFLDENGRIKNMPGTDYFPFITRTHTLKIKLSDIDLFRYEQDHVIVCLTDGSKYKMVGRMEDTYAYLTPDFQHAMASCIINMSHVVKMRDATVFFEGGQKFVLGLNNFHRLRHAFNGYLRD